MAARLPAGLPRRGGQRQRPARHQRPAERHNFDLFGRKGDQRPPAWDAPNNSPCPNAQAAEKTLIFITKGDTPLMQTAQEFSFPLVDNPQTKTCTQTPVLLVGLHIAHKVAPFTEWVWSTFEQVDNVPPDPDITPRPTPPPNGYSFTNGTDTPKTTGGYDHKPNESAISRLLVFTSRSPPRPSETRKLSKPSASPSTRSVVIESTRATKV